MIFNRIGADITRKVSAAKSNITSRSADLGADFFDGFAGTFNASTSTFLAEDFFAAVDLAALCDFADDVFVFLVAIVLEGYHLHKFGSRSRRQNNNSATPTNPLTYGLALTCHIEFSNWFVFPTVCSRTHKGENK